MEAVASLDIQALGALAGKVDREQINGAKLPINELHIGAIAADILLIAKIDGLLCSDSANGIFDFDLVIIDG